MKVTVIGLNYTPEPTGIAPYTAGAASGLREQGDEVEAITGYPHYPQWRVSPDYTGWSQHDQVDGVDVLRLRHPVPSSGQLVQRAVMEIVFGLRSILRSWGRPDSVLTISPALLSSALVVARAQLTRVPVVVWVQDIYTLGSSQTGATSAVARALQAVESWTLKHATRVIGIHPRFARFLTSELGVPREHIDVVRNWTHVNSDGGRCPELRARLGWGEDETIVLHAGNMGSKQNLQNVVRASRLAHQRGSKIRFVLLGDGHVRTTLEAMDANPNLQFIDPLPEDEFEMALTSADILLVNELPGMTEMSVPSKLTSYFNTGLPVLAAVDAGSITADEMARSGGGLRVDPDDPEALLDGAQRLHDDPEEAAAMGNSGKQYRARELNASASVQGIRESLRRAAAGRPTVIPAGSRPSPA